jgi:hypothetical protein
MISRKAAKGVKVKVKKYTLRSWRLGAMLVFGFRAWDFDGEKMGLKEISAILLFLGFVSGCASIGPGTVARDRFDYTTAISDSWKAQVLLNVVSCATRMLRCFWMWLRS